MLQTWNHAAHDLTGLLPWDELALETHPSQ